MEKLQRTAKWLDILCLALMILTGISAVAATAAQLTALGTGAVDPAAITMDGVSWSGDVRPGPLIAAGILIMLVSCGILLAGLALVRNCLKPMKAGLPFSGPVTQNLRRLGWLALGYACMDVFYELLGKGWLIRLAAMGGEPAMVSVAHQVNLNLFLLPALLFLFSYIFRYGEELQRLSDETL